MELLNIAKVLRRMACVLIIEKALTFYPPKWIFSKQNKKSKLSCFFPVTLFWKMNALC